MAIRIRLSRGGKKKQPCYRIVVANSTSPRDGGFIENIGFYHSTLSDESKRFSIDAERFTHWFKIGALPTERVALLASRIPSLKSLVDGFYNTNKTSITKKKA